jgi:hypothetical protein
LNKQDAVRQIERKMGKQSVFPSFTKGEAHLFKVIVQRTKTMGQGPNWKEHNVEFGLCPKKLSSLFRAAGYTSHERGERALHHLKTKGLINIDSNGIIANPSELLEYPDVLRGKCVAQRMREYRQRLKAQKEGNEVQSNG